MIYADTSFDKSPYDAWWLKDPLWTLSALPRLGKQLTQENMENLKDLIDACLSDNIYAEGRKSVKAETWAYAGDGAKRAADYLVQKSYELNSAKEDA